MSTFKRKTDLVDKVNELLNNPNVSEENKVIIKELLKSYENVSYKEHDDRHEFYRDVVEDMVNEYGFQDDKLAEKMANNHPTLQQSFFRMVKMFIEKMASKTYYDARNEASVKMCQKLNKVIEEENAYIPMI